MASTLSTLLIVLTFVTALPAARPARTKNPVAKIDDTKRRLESIEQSIEAMRRELGVPGLSLVIVQNDEVIYLKGFGLRDVERDLPVTPDTLFAIGSTTKAFTSMMVMISADQGKLSLDDRPRRFLPYFKLRDRTADAQSTLRDLLCHRTGLKSYSDLAVVTGVLNRQELIQVMGLAKPAARFREKLQYNNIMFSAAGEAVARANHTTWEELIQRLIFEPLEMKETNTSITRMQRSTDFSRGYSAPDAAGKNHALPFIDLSAIAPAGGINSNARELAQWLRLMLGRGVFNGKRLVSSQSFAQLWSPQIHVREHVDYGLGWVLADWNGVRLALHNGGFDGFHSLVEMVPSRNVGFALLANVDEPSLDARTRRIVWGNLLDVRTESSSPAATNVEHARAFVSPMSVKKLMQHMVAAAGGEVNLRKHRTMLASIALDFENQGVTGYGVVSAHAPNSQAVEITLTALGKKIGTTREYFDGREGGEESSFNAPENWEAGEFVNKKIEADFYNQLLDWPTLFKSVKIIRMSKLGAERVFVVEKIAANGASVLDYVSARSFDLLRRETVAGPDSDPVAESFSDFRIVDGVRVPFRVLQQSEQFGNVTIRIKKLRFNVDIADKVFHADGNMSQVP